MRVLKAQLDLTAQSAQTTRFTAPLWSLLVALLCSLGPFGHQALSTALYLPMIVTLMIALSSGLISLYLRRTETLTSLGEIRHWFLRLGLVQTGISVAWGLMPWVLWEPG